MNDMMYDIVLLPSDDVTKKSIAASNSLNAFESLFTLDGVDFFPHISLYMVRLQEDDVPEAIKRLNDISMRTSGMVLIANRYHHIYGFVDVEYRKVAEVSNLQKDVLDSINPIRDRVSENNEDISTLTGVKLENFENYGYVTVGELFRPHITFTRLKNDQTEDSLALVISALPTDISSFNGRFSKIGLFEMGENGTCIRKISEFELKSV